MKKILLQSAVLLAFASASPAATIAQWTFETSIPTTSGPHIPETGAGSAIATSGGTFSNPAGNGSAESWSSTGWDSGEYYQFVVSGAGFQDIKISYAATSSGTGPGNFNFEYSTDGSTFTSFDSYTQAANTWNTGSTSAASGREFDLSALSGLDNASSLAFRVAVNGNVSAGSTPSTPGTIASGGTFRIDDFTVSGEPIRTASVPEGGSSFGILSLAVAGLLGYRRTLRA